MTASMLIIVFKIAIANQNTSELSKYYKFFAPVTTRHRFTNVVSKNGRNPC